METERTAMSAAFRRWCISTEETGGRTKMDKKENAVRLVDVGKLEIELDTLLDLMLRDFADETDETKCHC